MSNPYMPPGADGPPQYSRSGVDLVALRKIATYQRFINLVILAQLIGMFCFGFMPVALQILGKVIFVVIGLGSSVACVLLANALYGVAAAIVCVPLMFIPCVNLITLLVFNQGATTRIKQ